VHWGWPPDTVQLCHAFFVEEKYHPRWKTELTRSACTKHINLHLCRYVDWMWLCPDQMWTRRHGASACFVHNVTVQHFWISIQMISCSILIHHKASVTYDLSCVNQFTNMILGVQHFLFHKNNTLTIPSLLHTQFSLTRLFCFNGQFADKPGSCFPLHLFRNTTIRHKRHRFFYQPDALPVTEWIPVIQWTVSKHWKKHCVQKTSLKKS